MAIASQKEKYLVDVRTVANMMANLQAICNDMKDKWWDRTYNSGGADEITQVNIDATSFSGLTLADLTSCISSIEGCITFLDTNMANMNKIRE